VSDTSLRNSFFSVIHGDQRAEMRSRVSLYCAEMANERNLQIIQRATIAEKIVGRVAHATHV
jgi:hypothetical protein